MRPARVMEGWNRNCGESVPSDPDWKLFGTRLLAARVSA